MPAEPRRDPEEGGTGALDGFARGRASDPDDHVRHPEPPAEVLPRPDGPEGSRGGLLEHDERQQNEAREQPPSECLSERR